jgi:hypothetical protein
VWVQDTSKNNIIAPVVESIPELAAFRNYYLKYRHFFGEHIDYTIPGYEEQLVSVGASLATFLPNDTDVLYQGASDGRLGKGITAYAAKDLGKVVRTASLSSSITNVMGFDRTPNVEGARAVLAAFKETPNYMIDLTRYDDPINGSYGCLVGYDMVRDAVLAAGLPNGEFYDNRGSWKQEKPYDAVISYVLYQFCGNNRDSQLQATKKFGHPATIYLFGEKFNPEKGQEEIWLAREQRKDAWKLQFFSPEEVSSKKREVLSKMQNFQVTQPDFEEALCNNFQYAVLVGSSANFFYYAASDSIETMNGYLHAMHPIVHDYTSDLPKIIAQNQPLDRGSPLFTNITPPCISMG